MGPLSVAHLAELRRRHVVRLLETFDAYKELLQHPGQTQRAYGLASVFLEMADGIADAIAMAAREPERRDDAAELPVGLQIQALSAIVQLSLLSTSVLGLPADLQEVVSRLASLTPEEIN